MEDQRDQHAPQTPQTTSYVPGAQQEIADTQLTSATPADESAPLPQGVIERVTRLVLRRAAYGLILGGRAIRPRLGWIVLTLFLVGVIGMETVALIAPLFIARLTDNRPPAIPTSPAVESFLQAQARYDAEMMWESFSPRFQAALIDQGTSKDQLAAKMKRAHDGGQRYTKISYVGGLTLAGEEAMYFYVVDVTSGQTSQSGTISFVFTVDKSGKITNIR
jgi:hypothetical protein